MSSPYRTVVVTPGASIDLTVLAAVKDELGITSSANDAWLQTKITQASNAIATSCNRPLHQETVADYFSLDWQHCRNNGALVLSRTPVASIVSLVEGNATIDVSNYEYDAEKGMVWRTVNNNVRGGYWLGGQIVVTYVGGYELLGTLPYDLEQACILLVKGSWFSKTRDPLIKSVSIPDVASYDYWVGGVGGKGAAFPPEVENLVAPYRRASAI